MAEQKKHNNQHWWHTIPVMLGAIAALITAVTGLIIGLNQIGWFSDGRNDDLGGSRSNGTTTIVDTPNKNIGEKLGDVKQKAPISKYHLKGTEFTLARGVTYFLPGGQITLVYTNKAPSGIGNPILIKINGKSRAMKTGDHYKIKDGISKCSLILLQITEDYKEVTFSYLCS